MSSKYWKVHQSLGVGPTGGSSPDHAQLLKCSMLNTHSYTPCVCVYVYVNVYVYMCVCVCVCVCVFVVCGSWGLLSL